MKIFNFVEKVFTMIKVTSWLPALGINDNVFAIFIIAMFNDSISFLLTLCTAWDVVYICPSYGFF